MFTGSFTGTEKLAAAKWDDAAMISSLTWPEGPIDVVMDTDTFNEIDDQFALSYLVRSEDKCTIRGIYAAPFFNENSVSPKDGMEKSYEEILKILTLLGREDLKQIVRKGAPEYLPADDVPVESEAVRHLIALSASYTREQPLYVIGTAVITDIASAILLDPTITQRIVVVWLGGHARHWPDAAEFNMFQDITGARVVFGSGVPLVQLPCMGVVSSLTVSEPELEAQLRGKNALCDYLCDVTEAAARRSGAGSAWTRIIWDVSAVAWLIDPSFEESRIVRAPLMEDDGHYAWDDRMPFMRYVYYVYRDRIFEDMFRKLTR